MLRQTTFVCILALSAVSGLRSQVSNATISGSVTDTSGARVPGAIVEIRNVDTGVVFSTHSDQSGIYSAPNLIIGRYAATVSKDGFGQQARTGIVLAVGKEEIVDFAISPEAYRKQLPLKRLRQSPLRPPPRASAEP